MNRLGLLWLLLVFPITHLAGQEFSEKNFVLYTTEEGLSHNTITGITQDSTGYVWITTASGLNRYNGSRFIQFHSNSDSISPASEELSGLVWLNKQQLAIYTTGLHIINTKTAETRNLFIPYHDRQYQYKFNMIGSAMGDNEGNIFILSRSGFYHYDKNFRLLSRFDFYSEADVPMEHFFFGRDLFELDDRRLLIVSVDGLYLYDKQKMKVKKMTADDCPLMAEFLNYPSVGYLFFQHKPGNFFILKQASDTLVYVNTIENKKTISRLPFKQIKTEFAWRSRMTIASDTVFYITGHFSGFYKMRFYPKSGEVKLYPEKYFSSFLCSSLLKDKDNHLWVATNRGLFREEPRKSQIQVAGLPAGMQDSFPNMRLADLYVSADKIYVGARGEGGLLMFDKKSFQFYSQVILNKIDKRNNHINAVQSVDSATLMLGTNSLLYLFNQSSKKAQPIIPPKWYVPGDWTNDLLKDSKGNIWISSHNIYQYNPLKRTFAFVPIHQRLLNLPVGIKEDRTGHIWMASHGLARYNATSDSFDLVIDSFPFIKMPDKQVNAFVIDQQNTVWFNSINNGLAGFDINKRTFRHYTTSDGLPNNNITSLMVLGNKLWIATYSGIACMDLNTSQIVSFGKEDGFPDVPIAKGAKFFYDTAEQQLYLSFTNAVTRFNPFRILQKKFPPTLFIENVLINGEKNNFLPPQSITTSWRDNEMMITIGSINFSCGHSQRFAYRIVKDSNTPWTEIGSQPSFSISSLSPGTNTIQVKAYSPNNRWPEQVKEISIVVLPPFWQEGWFIAVTGAVILVLLYMFIKWRTGLARKKEMEKTHIEKLKADDYKNQFELEQITNYFSSSLAGKRTKDEVLWDVARNLIGRMNYEDCIIYLWNEEKTKMVQKAAYGPKGKPEVISKDVFEVLPGQGIVGHVVQTRQPLLVKDTRIDERYRVDDEFRLSEVSVPIIHNDELLGVIDSEHRLPGYFSERDIKILTTIATLLGNKLKQIESIQSLEAKQRELAGINEQLAEARLSALQAQMNPHFVFNALNSIKRMILDGDNEKASRYLSKFALMIRMTLEHSKELFVTLDKNIEYLKAYLEMEQLRFDDSFTYSIFTDENLEATETPIPSMMIQPLVENAIWHGLMHAKADKKIRIAFSQSQNKITCMVEDNGIGIRQSEKLREKHRPLHNSLGLENLQKRIKIMNEKYEMACSLEITDLKDTGINGSGTRVVLRFNSINL